MPCNSDFSETERNRFSHGALKKPLYVKEFSVTEKIGFSWRPEIAIFRKQKKYDFSWRHEKGKFQFFLAPWKSDFTETEKITFFCAQKKQFFESRKKSLLMAPWKSNFSESEKIAFSWRPEKLIYRKHRNRFFVPFRKSDFSGTERNSSFWWKPKKPLFRNRINRFSLRPEKSILRKPKKYLFHGALFRAIFGNG